RPARPPPAALVPPSASPLTPCRSGDLPSAAQLPPARATPQVPSEKAATSRPGAFPWGRACWARHRIHPFRPPATGWAAPRPSERVRALEVKNRLAGRLAKAQADIQASNSIYRVNERTVRRVRSLRAE